MAALLRDLMLKTQYRSDYHSIVRDFYEQCLPESSDYGRAVGFFSSGIFSACPRAFYEFFKNGGKARVVASHILFHGDIKAVYEGYHDRHQLAKVDKLELLNNEGGASRDQEILSWLIAKDRVALKVAVSEKGTANALYHEKQGFFEDEESNCLVFSGSANESLQAVKRNFEQLDIFRSWKKSEWGRAEQKRRDFERLWSDQTPGLKVLAFPAAARQGLLEERSQDRSDDESHDSLDGGENVTAEVVDFGALPETLSIPVHIDLYSHQKEGIREWFSAGGKGILEMATGSGKTITALSTAVKLYEWIGPPFFLIVVCPYLHLVDQWVEEAKDFGLDPLVCARGWEAWYEDFQVRLYNSRTETRQITSAVTTNSTFRSETFQRLLANVDVPLLFIGDEVHNLGAPNLRQQLPGNASYRLGLSATPERWFDPEGTEILEDYFGDSLVQYTLEEALTDGVLCPYLYIPHPVELTEDETNQYLALTRKIGRSLGGRSSEDDLTPQLERLLIKRARLVATAENKLDLLRSLMTPRRQSKHTLVYCGDGRVEEPEAEEEMRQIRAVTRMLGNDLLMRVAMYTAETSTERRRKLRDDFADGRVQCLVAIRCLDEGVDIPETKHAFILASTSNPRQFIQRRGRLLRRSPGKEMAEIHDFVVAPPTKHRDAGSEHFATTRRLFGRELQRVAEFAKLATNGPEAMNRLLDIRDELNLLDIDFN